MDWDLSRGGQWLLRTSIEGHRTIVAWDTRTSEHKPIYSHPRANLYLANFSNDGRWAVFTSEEGVRAPHMCSTDTDFAPERLQGRQSGLVPLPASQGRRLLPELSDKGICSLSSMPLFETDHEHECSGRGRHRCARSDVRPHYSRSIGISRVYFLSSIRTTLACGSSVVPTRTPARKRSPVQAFLMWYCAADGTKSDKGRSRAMAFSPRLNAARAC